MLTLSGIEQMFKYFLVMIKWDKNQLVGECTVIISDYLGNKITVPFKLTPPNINLKFEYKGKFIEVPISTGWLYKVYVLGEFGGNKDSINS